MARYAVLDKDGLVVNVIEWDGLAKWSPPDGCTVQPDLDNAIEIKDVWDDNTKTLVRNIQKDEA